MGSTTTEVTMHGPRHKRFYPIMHVAMYDDDDGGGDPG